MFQENETTMCPVPGMAAEAQGSLRDVEGRSCERSRTVAGVRVMDAQLGRFRARLRAAGHRDP